MAHTIINVMISWLMVLIPFFILLYVFAFTFTLNLSHQDKYSNLIFYLKQNHPEIYEEVRIKTIWGGFYKKYGTFAHIRDFALNHTVIDDPKAEELLADYANFSKKISRTAYVRVIALFVSFFWLISSLANP
ncbi:MAG: hypothetical protein AAF702_13935 [Chloroflexota bacterium]